MVFSLGLSVFLRPKNQIMYVQDRLVTYIHHFVDYHVSTTQQSLKYKGPLEWNQLPLELRNSCKTLKSFDLKIHHYLTTAAKWFS